MAIKESIKTFTSSVNIIRDIDRSLEYIPTENARQTFSQIFNDYKTGTRAFNIVGAYGVGKSAFLWALEKQITKSGKYFSTGASHPLTFDIINVVGEHMSLIQCFAEHFEISTSNARPKDIITAIVKYANKVSRHGNGLAIVIDEFGKFLEFAASNNPNRELYFIQQLAETANSLQNDILLVTTLHQDFNGYSLNLTKPQQNEWDKVKGRLKELTFNEPVEQLVFLAAERLKIGQPKVVDKSFKQLLRVIDESKAFPLRDYFTEEIALNILPFDMLSLSTLALALQKYGQNERSLFSFIETNDFLGLAHFKKNQKGYFNLSHVYDYLAHNFYSVLNTAKNNLHYVQWSAIRNAIERTEGLLGENTEGAVKIIKAIGILNIFSSGSRRLGLSFLKSYSSLAMAIDNTEEIIKLLEGHRIIRFVKHLNTYILFEGTSLNIEMAIDEAGNLVEEVSNVIEHLNKYFDFPYTIAKSVSYEIGTPRFFGYHLSELPFISSPSGEVDGFINLIFSNNITEKEIVEYSRNCKAAVLFGWYRNTHTIKAQIYEIEKVKKVIESHSDDIVAVKELKKILHHHIALLNHYVLGNMYLGESVKWYYKGEVKTVLNRKSFNRLLSEICHDVYSKTPTYKNEMVNKSTLSSPIAAARKKFIAALVTDWNKEDIGFVSNKFPPEKTIYLSLLKNTGIHRNVDGVFTLARPTDDSTGFEILWDECVAFLDSTKTSRRCLQELFDLLLTQPFKLKQGLVDFWIATFLFANRDDFALFYLDSFVPVVNSENLELILKHPRDYHIKAFNIDGLRLELFNKYRTLVDKSEREKPTGKEFIDTIRPFLTFYKNLPEYAKNTQRLTKTTISLRSAIASAKDPEDAFFEQFPKAFNYNINELQRDKAKLAEYIAELQNGIRDIRTCFEALLTRIEAFIGKNICSSVNFPNYKNELQTRFRGVKAPLLLPHQRIFYDRVYSKLEDRNSWLSSIVQACIGKPVNTISDDDEVIFCDKLKDIVHELDNLVDASIMDFDKTKEIAYKLEVNSFITGLKKNLVRIPISKSSEMDSLTNIVQKQLTNDRQLNIAVLAKLLEDLITDEKS